MLFMGFADEDRWLLGGVVIRGFFYAGCHMCMNKINNISQKLMFVNACVWS